MRFVGLIRFTRLKGFIRFMALRPGNGFGGFNSFGFPFLQGHSPQR